MADLIAHLRLLAHDGVSAVAKRVQSELKNIGNASKAAQKLTQSAADLSAAQQSVSRFATGTRQAILSLVDSSDQFEDKMALLAAESGGLSREQLANTSAAIYDVAQATRFTSDTVQSGFLVMANAGLNAEQQIAAMAPAARLAMVTGADLAQTATFTAKALRGFGLEASDTTKVTDVLRAGAGEAGLTIQTMGELMGKVAPKAKGLGTGLDETAAVIAGFGKAGIQGADAITAVDTVFKRLGKGLSKQDMGQLGIDPKKVTGTVDLLEKIAKGSAKFSAGARERGFSKMFEEAGPAASRLFDGIRSGEIDLQALRTQMERSGGTVAGLAEEMEGTGAAASHRLGQSWLELKNTLGDALSPAAAEFNTALADGIRSVTSFAKENPGLVKSLALVAGAVAGVATVVSGVLSVAMTAVGIKAALVFGGGFGGVAKLLAGPFVSALKGVLLPMKLVTGGLAKMLIASTGAAAPFVAVGLAIGGVTLAIQQLVKHWDELNFMEGLKGIAQSLGESGILSTVGQLLDPRTLLKDIGIMGDTPDRIAPGAGSPVAGGKQEIGGTLHVKVDSEGRARVNRMESRGGIQMDVSTGYTLAGAAGGL